RNTQSKGISGTTSTWYLIPLTVSSIMSVCPFAMLSSSLPELSSKRSYRRLLRSLQECWTTVPAYCSILRNSAQSCSIAVWRACLSADSGAKLAGRRTGDFSKRVNEVDLNLPRHHHPVVQIEHHRGIEPIPGVEREISAR